MSPICSGEEEYGHARALARTDWGLNCRMRPSSFPSSFVSFFVCHFLFSFIFLHYTELIFTKNLPRSSNLISLKLPLFTLSNVMEVEPCSKSLVSIACLTDNDLNNMHFSDAKSQSEREHLRPWARHALPLTMDLAK